MRVADEINCSRFGGRHKDSAVRRVEALRRHFRETLPREECDADASAKNWPAILRKEDLEFLRAMMGRAVILCCRKQAHVVAQAKSRQEVGNEVRSGNTAKRAVFRWNDDVKASCRRADELLSCQTTESILRGNRRDSEGSLQLVRREQELPAGSEAVQVATSNRMALFRFHSRKVA